MADVNPYRAPQASVADAPTAAGELAAPPNRVDAGRGVQWLMEGFSTFRQAPLAWIGIIVVAFIVFVLLGLVPFIGQLAAQLLGVLFAGGLMLGCRALDQGEDFTIGHLFAGFQRHTGPLIMLSVLYLVGFLAIILVVGTLSFGSVMAIMSGDPGRAAQVGGATIVLIFLAVFALSIPLMMAIWFAPALVALHDLAPIDAMKRSFAGCLRNMLPFLLYGVVGLVAAIIATIPLMLGWLVLGPVLVGSIYAAYRDIFLESR